MTIGTGTQVLTLPTALSYQAGEAITLVDSANPGSSMTGTIVSYSPATGALILNVTSDTGAGATVSGNWSLGISFPQSVVNSFLANDYFTPTSVNTAHQTFYGLNSSTGAAGTLMSFVQNPFNGNDAAALAGLSGGKIQIGHNGSAISLNAASAVHVSPEIDLLNPQTSVNGGDISVLSNWNLGAGVAGLDGNPASLYFRYNGWAPTLVLRAAGNINLDASITDGFFQKAATVGANFPVPAINYNSVYGSNSASGTYLYTAYLAAYDTYLKAYINWTNSVNRAATLPVAPLPPPAISGLTRANNSPAPIRTPTDQSPIAGMDLVAEASSSSYRFIAGAQFAPGGAALTVNPAAVVPVASSGTTDTGDITLSGHISYSNTGFSAILTDPSTGAQVTYYPRVDVPTIIRTGTGSIELVAADDIKWLDALSPAAVYTAGTVAPNAADFTAPTLPGAYTSGQSVNGFVTTPAWATGGGALTLSAGRDVIGIETPVDSELLATVRGSVDAQTLGSNSPSMAQFWSAWYMPVGVTTGGATAPFDSSAGGVQNSAYINYGTFFQGVGALGGGNVTVSSGRNTYDLSVSLPETIQVSGGRFAGDAAPTAHYYGGGDLSVTVGNNLYSGAFYVGRGSGTVRVAGSVLTDTANPITGQSVGVYQIRTNSGAAPISLTTPNFFTPLPLLLAEQDGYITVQAGGSLAVGGVFQPTRMPLGYYPYYPLSYLPAGSGSGFDSFGPNSGVTLMAAGGDLSLVDAAPPTLGSANPVFSGHQTFADNVLPPNLEAISVAGNLTIGNLASIASGPYYLYPSTDGNSGPGGRKRPVNGLQYSTTQRRHRAELDSDGRRLGIRRCERL